MEKGISKSSKKGMIFRFAIAIAALILLGGILLTRRNTSLPESRELFTLNEYSNVTVVVVFDTEELPVVQFIAPDGGRVDMENIRNRPGSNFIQFFLPNSMPGTWIMAYNPLTNTNISSPYFIYTEHIMIMDFEAHMLLDENGNIPVMF